ncbi:class I SAM-dependent methyltransferase [Streptomyces sp. CS-7]|uniref:class I SAM-dependent methyltransferase n=1 Tax=Streptomyces sp. CS-7 TaxID=2906769 RepID=UPI0028C3B454|nr:class I SAM-dependent methyltransferase [Streptomyces sp. CS-7]
MCAAQHADCGWRTRDAGCACSTWDAALAPPRPRFSLWPRARTTGVDASAGMLDRAVAKSGLAGVDFVHAPVEELADRLRPGSFDAVFAGYLFRNLDDPDKTLDLVRDLLVPGGRLAVHEYTLGGSPAHRVVWNAVCSVIIQPAGRLAGGADLYRHLRHSVTRFDTAPAFAQRLRRTGFADVRVLPLPGWQTGITHTFIARATAAAGRGS